MAGYWCAAEEIASGCASWSTAWERGLYRDNQDHRIEWDRGYEDACCAYRLGHDPAVLAREGLYGPGILSKAAVVADLLDSPESRATTRADPRTSRRTVTDTP